MNPPNSNFQIGQMRHQEYEAEFSQHNGHAESGVSKKTILRWTTVLSGGFIVALFVVQVIIF